MIIIQELVHKFENLTRARVFKGLVMLLAAALLAVVYDLRNFRNMSTQEAMDSAQLARNVSEGRGFTTRFIRPFSLHLLQRTRGAGTNSFSLDGAIPDISNPPVYPVVLAGWMKVMPFRFEIPAKDELIKPFWGNNQNFRRYQPDFLIAVFNQLLLLLVVVLTFLWARKLFDSVVAWSTAILLLCTELLWRFSVSGLSTLLLMLIFMLLVWCLTWLEIEAREPKRGRSGAMILAGAAGVILGIGAMTRYSFAWLILPTLVFMFVSTGPRRVNFCLVTLIYFAVAITPWIVRNYSTSGAAFGTATYSVLADTALFPGYQLERSLDPDLRVIPKLVWGKLFANLHAIRQGNLFNIGTGWGTALFLTGFLIAFRNLTLTRVRYFVIGCLGVLIVAQALGRTQLAVDSPDINSENLLVLLLPVVVVYAVSFFWMLLERLQLPPLELWVVGGFFGLVSCLSLILSLIKSEPSAVAYPPYYPPVIQQTASWMQPDEWMMSDIPWAVAWYGHQPCVWLVLDAVPEAENATDIENILALDQEFKPVNALYLTPLTIDSRLLSDCIRTRDNGWGNFVLRCLARREVPDNFPLHEMPVGFLPEQLFLADSKRWQGSPLMPQQPSVDPALLPDKPDEKTEGPVQRSLRKPRFR